MPNVTHFEEFAARDTVAALEELLARATRGQIRGLAFAIKTGPLRHRLGLTGDYWKDPGEALKATARMQYKANQLITERESDGNSQLGVLGGL